MTINRREFVKTSGLTLGFVVAGSRLLLTPAEAHAKSIPFSVLTDDEVSVLEAVCEILVPGAGEAGVAHFVDQQLGVDANDSLLLLKYFNYPPPYADFYRAALRAITMLSRNLFGKDVEQLDAAQSRTLIVHIRDGSAGHWGSTPAPLVYHALRNDAVDVVYGTPAGFKKLGVPYMEHILPPENWS